MPLVDVRKQFVQFSGRYDLVIDRVDWADNGADFFITAGQRWLDRRAFISKNFARNFQHVAKGSWYALVPDCRSIEAVYIATNDAKRKLKKRTYREFRKCYPKNPTQISSGNLTCSRYCCDCGAYAIFSLRTSPEIQEATVIDVYEEQIISNSTPIDYFQLVDDFGKIWSVVAGNTLDLLTFRDKPAFVDGRVPNALFPSPMPSLAMTMIDGVTPAEISIATNGDLIIDSGTTIGPRFIDMRAMSGFMNTLTIEPGPEYRLLLGEKLPISTPNFNYEGVLFSPPITEESGVTLEIYGSFYSMKLVEDSDVNYWSEEHPFILVIAACRALEISYRNSQGVKDWEDAISNEIFGLELDFAAMESNEFRAMEG